MFWGPRKSYSGRHVLITGGSTGIGLALGRELVQRGAHVTLLARTQSKLDTAVAELRALADKHSLSVHVKAIAADTCSAKEVLRCVSWHSCTTPTMVPSMHARFPLLPGASSHRTGRAH